MTGDLKRFEKAVGDAGYLSVENCRLAAGKGAKPHFMIKKNAGLRTKDDRAAAWNNMMLEFRANKMEWLDAYHARSCIEAVFSSIKRCFGSTVKSMKKRIQRKELSLKAIAYNIKQSLYAECSRLWELNLWVAP